MVVGCNTRRCPFEFAVARKAKTSTILALRLEAARRPSASATATDADVRGRSRLFTAPLTLARLDANVVVPAWVAVLLDKKRVLLA